MAGRAWTFLMLLNKLAVTSATNWKSETADDGPSRSNWLVGIVQCFHLSRRIHLRSDEGSRFRWCRSSAYGADGGASLLPLLRWIHAECLRKGGQYKSIASTQQRTILPVTGGRSVYLLSCRWRTELTFGGTFLPRLRNDQRDVRHILEYPVKSSQQIPESLRLFRFPMLMKVKCFFFSVGEDWMQRCSPYLQSSVWRSLYPGHWRMRTGSVSDFVPTQMILRASLYAFFSITACDGVVWLPLMEEACSVMT